MALCAECIYMSVFRCVEVYIGVQYTQKHVNIRYTCIFIYILVFWNESKMLIGVNDLFFIFNMFVLLSTQGHNVLE